MEPLPLTIGQDVKAQLRNDLDLELKAVVMYNEAIKTAQAAGDNSSRVALTLPDCCRKAVTPRVSGDVSHQGWPVRFLLR